MVTRRAAKTKGSSFEYDVQYTLKQRIQDLYLTKERGFQYQFDIVSESQQVAIECKRHAGFSWNKLTQIYQKLSSRVPHAWKKYVVFQSNRQPPLVMYVDHNELVGYHYTIKPFEAVFGIYLQEHPSSRRVIREEAEE